MGRRRSEPVRTRHLRRQHGAVYRGDRKKVHVVVRCVYAEFKSRIRVRQTLHRFRELGDLLFVRRIIHLALDHRAVFEMLGRDVFRHSHPASVQPAILAPVHQVANQVEPFRYISDMHLASGFRRKERVPGITCGYRTPARHLHAGSEYRCLTRIGGIGYRLSLTSGIPEAKNHGLRESVMAAAEVDCDVTAPVQNGADLVSRSRQSCKRLLFAARVIVVPIRSHVEGLSRRLVPANGRTRNGK